ncbi:hypothetical protein FWC31_04040 [Candidatus Saccharibacteria bacterium]|nr:hypothetical protein [Candidatus Saccharibacteria bacterium]
MNSNDPNIISGQSNTPVNPESYLDAISNSQPIKNRFLSGKILAVLIGALIILTLIIIGVISNNMRQTAQDKVVSLNSKLSDLQSVVRYGQSNLPNNSEIIKVVAETNLIILSRQNELAEIYTLSDDTTPAANGESITADLDDAKARGNLDSVYVTVLRDQLLSVCNQLEILYDSAKTNTQKITLAKAYADFQELANRLPTS